MENRGVCRDVLFANDVSEEEDGAKRTQEREGVVGSEWNLLGAFPALNRLGLADGDEDAGDPIVLEELHAAPADEAEGVDFPVRGGDETGTSEHCKEIQKG